MAGHIFAASARCSRRGWSSAKPPRRLQLDGLLISVLRRCHLVKQATSWLDAAETAPPVRVERVALCSAVSAESVQRVAAAVQPAMLSQLGPEDETNGLLADVMFGQPPPAWVLNSRR